MIGTTVSRGSGGWVSALGVVVLIGAYAVEVGRYGLAKSSEVKFLDRCTEGFIRFVSLMTTLRQGLCPGPTSAQRCGGPSGSLDDLQNRGKVGVSQRNLGPRPKLSFENGRKEWLLL